MKRLISTATEFYIGLISAFGIAFLIPLLVTTGACTGWAFLGYLYLPIGFGLLGHALYCEERDYLKVEARESEDSSSTD
jgi:hypothetical protein